MKWNPRDAIALHAAQVLADPKSKEEDLVSARKAIANPFCDEVLDALPDEDLARLHADLIVEAEEASDRFGRCAVCGAETGEQGGSPPSFLNEAGPPVPAGGSGPLSRT